jgi:hypothetical protein
VKYGKIDVGSATIAAQAPLLRHRRHYCGTGATIAAQAPLLRHEKEERSLGIIHSLSSGFDAITKRIWLISIPILLDIYLWMGPRLSIYPLAKRALSTVALPASASPEELLVLTETKELLEQASQSFNAFSLLVIRKLGMPSLISPNPWLETLGITLNISRLVTFQTPEASFFVRPLPVIEVWSESVLLGLYILLSLVGMLIGCSYLGLIAQEVRDNQVNVAHVLRRVWIWWARVALIALLFFMGLLMLGTPLLLIVALLSLLSRNLAQLIGNFIIVSSLWAGIWLYIYLFFFVNALILNDTGILRAIWNSFSVVRRNFWSTIGLMLLIGLIGAGFSIIWRMLSTSSWGTLLAILGNAYIGSSLAAASFTFYRDRYVAWQEELAGQAEAGQK